MQPTFAGTVWLTAGLLLGVLVTAGMAVASLRQDGENIGQCYRRFLAKGLWEAFGPAASSFAFLFGIMSLVAIGGAMPALLTLFAKVTRNGPYPEWLEMVIALPSVPIWLFGSVFLLVLSRKLSHGPRRRRAEWRGRA